MFKRIPLYLFFCFSVEWFGFVLSIGDIVDSRLSQKVIYAEPPTPHFKEFCSYAIGKIYENQEGKRLVDKISEFLLESSIDEVRFVDFSGTGSGTAFVHNAEFDINMEVKAVPENVLYIVRVVSPETHWCDQLFGISECIYGRKNIENIGNIFRISKVFSPFYVTIVHELIHLKHFLESFLHKDEKSISYGKAVTIGTYK